MIKTLRALLLTILLIGAASAQVSDKYVIAIHGGAGSTSPDLPEEVLNKYYEGLENALTIGKEILEEGGVSLDAVEAVVAYLETNPAFNAGIGAVLTSEGKAELDASIMDGRDLSCGAVGSVTRVKSPIELARTVMEKSDYVFFVSEGAEKFAEEQGLEMVENDYFVTERRVKSLERYKEAMKEKEQGMNTVGAVALDKYGNLAAATSTGGRSFKAPGRVGDTPIIGAGTYADNNTCAVSSTGIGEEFIRHNAAYNISALMKFKSMTLKEAADEVLNNILSKGDGGFITVDKDGNYYLPFSTPSMLRGVATSDGLFDIKIFGDK